MKSNLVLLEFLFFPGLLFTAVAGLLTSWVDRKVTALVQMRVGPPLLQPFHDIRKLFIKETCVPEGGAIGLFLLAPLLGLAAVTLASMILWRTLLDVEATFVGDLIVLIYLLVMPALSVMLGSFASRNPLASLGGSREVKLMIAYELPLVLAILVPVIHANSIRLGDLVTANAPVFNLSGVLALLVCIACMQAKLTIVPFDMPEAETELSGGALIEYSGPPLAMFKLTRAMMLFTMPVLLVVLFFGGLVSGPGWLPAVIGFLLWFVLVALTIVLRNTTPRVRIDQAVRFFWGPVSLVALLAAVLAWLGW
ncbi:MAG: NADH-quinone oxidoreductase subunit H [Gammaproteobacteria bacterium]|nr:NADH-quinone oxidoreductase subunit H [Gammaproteobacteria bacterium]NNK99534.1 NADH-quinone oxidoreductase subunit H [Xanthomonadales bacterium]